jgi:hypothetical protein
VLDTKIPVAEVSKKANTIDIPAIIKITAIFAGELLKLINLLCVPLVILKLIQYKGFLRFHRGNLRTKQNNT